MVKQKYDTDLALTKRIGETRETKEKLEQHLHEVLKQITELEDNIYRLQKAIADKEAPIKLSETRLENRTGRPNVELCRDQVQYRLIEEVNEINASIAELQKRLEDSKASHKGLVRRQLDLEQDIEIKSETLFIDDTECDGMRRTINIQSF